MKPDSNPIKSSSVRNVPRIRHAFSVLLLAAVLPLFCFSAQAQTWDGGAGDNLWSSAANWDTDTLPDATNSVSIGLDANVVLDFDTTNRSLFLGVTNSGYAGAATLSLTNGNSVSEWNTYVGDENTGTLQILNGSRFNTILLYVGTDTRGTVTVNAGTAAMNNLWLGAGSPGAEGILILTNASSMTCQPFAYGDGTCYIGETGTGTIIADNSTINLTNSSVVMGDNEGSTGSLILKNGAVLNAYEEGIYVGRNGSGSLSLDASALNGEYSGITLGNGNGNGLLLLTNGSTLSCQDFTSYLPGTAVVDGSQMTGSTMNEYDGLLTLQHAAAANFGTIYIGYFDTNLARITLDASTMVANSIVVGPYSSENNQLIVTNGSLLTVTNPSSSGTLEMRYGTLEFDGGTIFADHLKSAYTNAAIHFSGGLMDCGSANISNTQPFVAGNGTDLAEYHLHGGSHIFADGLHISANAALTGNGTVSGAVTVATGGTLSPGDSIGTISLSNSPALQGNVVLEINKTSTTLTNDQLRVLAPLTYGGTLTVSNVGPDALAAGDSFQLFSASNYDGSFTSMNLPPLDSGLTWTNRLLTDGSIAIIALPIPAIHLTTQPGGDLVFTVTNGSPDAAYDLLTSTNLALPLSDWTTNRSGHFDTSGNRAFTNSISPDEPQRFFLLKTP